MLNIYKLNLGKDCQFNELKGESLRKITTLDPMTSNP